MPGQSPVCVSVDIVDFVDIVVAVVLATYSQPSVL